MVELMGMKKWLFPVFEYGERWRTYRRLFHEFFNVATADRYDEGQKKAASRLLKNLSEHPADFLHHTKLATGSLSLEIAYEIQVDSRDNPYFRAAEEAIEGMVTAMIPGAFPAEFFPFRKFLIAMNYQHLATSNSLGSSPFSIMASWRRCPQLWGTRLQVIVGWHNVANAICH